MAGHGDEMKLMCKVFPFALQTDEVRVGKRQSTLLVVHGVVVKQSGIAKEEGFHLKRIVSMMSHLHERQAGSPQLESFAVDSETESAGYSGEERLLPRPARSLYALINGITLAAETFGSERTHP